MRPDAQPRVRVNNFLILVTGGIVLGMSIGVTLLILGSVFGRYETSDLLPTWHNIKRVVADQDDHVAILSSGYSARNTEEGSAWLNSNVNVWARFAKSHELRLDVIDDAMLEFGSIASYNLLILPGTRALSDTEIIVLKTYLDRGGSIFATGGTGSLREDGGWRGWEFLSEVFGIQFVREISPDGGPKIHTLRGDLPITGGIPTGYALKVATWDRPMVCRVLEPRTTQASFWYDFVSDSGLVSEEINNTAGIVYGSYGKGKFVWMGFELNSVLGGENDYVVFDKLCKQSVDWLTRQPTVVIRDWPLPYAAAAVVTPVLSREFANINNLLDVFRAEKFPVSFFVDPVAAEQYPALTETLASYGEIGAIVQEHTSYRESKLKLEKIARTPVKGALAGDISEATVHSLLASGLEYFMSDSITDRSVPQTVIRGDRSIIMLSKTARDDRDVITKFGLQLPAFQFYTYQEGVERVAFQGGLYVLRPHTDLQLRTENISVLRDLLRYIRKQQMWLATAGEVSTWWRVCNALEVSARARSDRRIALVISNPTDYPIKNVGVDIGINKNVTNVDITSDILGTVIPPFTYDPKKQTVEITLPDLRGGGSVSYFIDFDNVSPNPVTTRTVTAVMSTDPELRSSP